MIPQRSPLYAIDARNTAVFLVVGWQESNTRWEWFPVLAPMTVPGPTLKADGSQVPHLVYSPQPRPIFPLPAPDDTAVIPAVRPAGGRLRP